MASLYKIHQGQTSFIAFLDVLNSTVTTGAGLTGLTSATAGLTAYYYNDAGSGSTAITLAAMTMPTWVSGGFVELDATHMPGIYALGVPNAALAGGKKVKIVLMGAANMAQTRVEIELDQVDYQDSMRFGLQALPNFVNNSTGGLPVCDSQLGVNLSNAAVASVAGDLDTTMQNRGYTATRATNLDRLDAAVTTRLATTSYVAPDTGAAIAADVLNATAASYNTANSIGAKINAAGTAADPWATVVPGAYGAGTAGNILGNNLNATVSSRLPTASYVAPDTGTAIAADVLNATAASYNTANSIGAKINAAGTSADPWATALPGAYGAGTAGKILGTNLDAVVSGDAGRVWNMLTSALTTAGSIGALLKLFTFSGSNVNAAAQSISDKAGYALSAGEHLAISGTDVPAGLTTQGYTGARAAKLDNSDVAVSTRATQAQVVGGVTALSVDTSGRVRLQPTGLDDIAVGDIANNADARSSLPKMCRAIFNRFYNRVQVTSVQETVANDTGAVTMTMTIADDGTTFTKSKSI